jgi:hypothetical protein
MEGLIHRLRNSSTNRKIQSLCILLRDTHEDDPLTDATLLPNLLAMSSFRSLWSN